MPSKDNNEEDGGNKYSLSTKRLDRSSGRHHAKLRSVSKHYAQPRQTPALQYVPQHAMSLPTQVPSTVKRPRSCWQPRNAPRTKDQPEAALDVTHIDGDGNGAYLLE